MSVAPVQQPATSVAALPPKSFAQEKMIRLALQIAGYAALVIAVTLTGLVIASAIPGIHILTAGALGFISSQLLEKANEFYDLNDPDDLQRAKKDLCLWDVSKMIDKFPLETFFQYQMKDLDWLRVRCAQELHKRKYYPIPELRKHADSLLAYKVITPAMHRALADDNAAELARIVPNNTDDLDKLFQP